MTVAGREREPKSALLEVKQVTKRFPIRARRAVGARKRFLTAVDHASLTIHQGEVVALVGESGSGKSTLARVVSQLSKQTSGDICLDGKEVIIKGRRAYRRYCGDVQLIFQDPFASLNPLRTVRYHLVDPLKIHHNGGADVDAAAAQLLERVSLVPAERFIDRYPHELSGGQRQRVSIARALAANPRILLADEPVSMLDVSIRLGILNLLEELKHELDVGILYITHDIASARYFADRTLVMYAGQIVESGTSEDVTQNPHHPYTRLLIDSAPNPAADQPSADSPATQAEPPSLISPPRGCRFHPRCPAATEKCAIEEPPEVPLAAGGFAKCWAWSAEPSDLPLPRLAETPL